MKKLYGGILTKNYKLKKAYIKALDNAVAMINWLDDDKLLSCDFVLMVEGEDVFRYCNSYTIDEWNKILSKTIFLTSSIKREKHVAPYHIYAYYKPKKLFERIIEAIGYRWQHEDESMATAILTTSLSSTLDSMVVSSMIARELSKYHRVLCVSLRSFNQYLYSYAKDLAEGESYVDLHQKLLRLLFELKDDNNYPLKSLVKNYSGVDFLKIPKISSLSLIKQTWTISLIQRLAKESGYAFVVFDAGIFDFDNLKEVIGICDKTICAFDALDSIDVFKTAEMIITSFSEHMMQDELRDKVSIISLASSCNVIKSVANIGGRYEVTVND